MVEILDFRYEVNFSGSAELTYTGVIFKPPEGRIVSVIMSAK